jgi:hypothetical protein
MLSVETQKKQSTTDITTEHNGNMMPDTTLQGTHHYNLTEPSNNQQRTTRTKTPSYTSKDHNCTRMPSAEPLGRSAACPGSSWNLCVWCGGRCSGEHAREVTAKHHGQLAVQVGEAGGMLVPRLGESGVGGFAEELPGTGTEPPQGFKRDCAECISRAVVVGKEVSAHVGIPKSSGVARVRGAERM